ncbi:MAG: MFS transporter [Clostridia bacterium]|nr:MFS transporter [Clostridia bacterium]
MPIRISAGLSAAGRQLRGRFDSIGNKRELGSFIRHYVSFYIIYGVFGSYLSTYYSIAGISKSQIGLLMAIGPLTSLLIQPVWGILSDKSNNKVRILRIIAAGGTLTVFLYFIPSGFIGFALVSVAFMSFHTAMMPLSDAYAVNYLTRNGQKFSFIRLCGSTAYTLSAFLSGFVLDNDNLRIIFPFTAVMYVVGMLNMGTLPRMPLERSVDRKPFRDVIRNRKLILILVFVFFMQLPLCFNGSFMGVYIKDLGFSDRIRGTIFSLVALSEIPVLLVIDRVIRRFPVMGILVFSGSLMVVRVMIYAFLPTPGFILLGQLLNGMTFMPVTYSAITYINNEMPAEYKTTGQSLLALVQQGAGNILGSVLGGVMSSRIGIGNTYAVFGAMLAVVTAIFVIILIRGEKPLYRSGHPDIRSSGSGERRRSG